MNQWTRYLTIIVLLLQGSAYIANLYHKLPSEAFVLGPDNFLFKVSTIVVLTAGTMFVMWLGEKITDKGLGNGISLIIMVGIIARLPQALLVEFNMRWAEAVGGMVMLVVEIVILYLVFMATISVLQAVRKVPVQYAKRIVGNKQYGGVRQYIPLKLNAANVMPIIFAQAIMFIPMLFGGKVGAAMANYTGFWYNFVFAILVILFTYFYTAIIVNPNMMADELKRNGGFIPGVKPGKGDLPLSGHHHDENHTSGLHLPCYRGYSAGVRIEAGHQPAVLPLFRRYLAADSHRSYSRHSQAGRKLPPAAPLRRSDEDRTCERPQRLMLRLL